MVIPGLTFKRDTGCCSQSLLPEKFSEKQGEVDVFHIAVPRLSELLTLNSAQTHAYCSMSQLQREQVR